MSFYVLQILLCFVFATLQKYKSSHGGYDQTYAECKPQLKGEQKLLHFHLKLEELRCMELAACLVPEEIQFVRQSQSKNFTMVGQNFQEKKL